jgi:hypothetical protein
LSQIGKPHIVLFQKFTNLVLEKSSEKPDVAVPSVIPPLRRQRQEDLKLFKASLGYKGRHDLQQVSSSAITVCLGTVCQLCSRFCPGGLLHWDMHALFIWPCVFQYRLFIFLNFS